MLLFLNAVLVSDLEKNSTQVSEAVRYAELRVFRSHRVNIKINIILLINIEYEASQYTCIYQLSVLYASLSCNY